MSMASLLEQVVGTSTGCTDVDDVDITGARFGCGARDDRERRACALYLWLLGPTTTQLATNCPCKR